MLLVKNCNLLSMAGIEYEKYDVLMDGGKFVRIEKEIEAPEGAEVIDAAGRLVTPGFIESHCHLGLTSESGGSSNETGNPVLAGVRGLDSIDFDAPQLTPAIHQGLTTLCVGPGSANLIGGFFCAIKTGGDSVEEKIMVPELAMKMALGENPRLRYGKAGKTPSTRMGCAYLIRDALLKAKAYREKWLAHQEKLAKGEASSFSYDLPMHNLMRVFDGMLVKIHAHEAEDIMTAMRIGKEFGLNVSVEHTTEGWMIPEELRNGCGKYILGPIMGGMSKAELRNKRYDCPAMLEKAGVPFAITTDSGVIQIHLFLTQLCMLVKYGLSRKTALEAVTINAAKVVCLEDRIGSVEVGKDADLVVWDEDPLSTNGRPGYVIIGGKVRLCEGEVK